MTGPKRLGDSLGGGLMARLEGTHAAYRKKMEEAALPGESIQDTEQRLKRTADGQVKNPEESLPSEEKAAVRSKSAMRKPPNNDRQADFFVPGLYDVATKDNRSLMDVALFRLSKRDKRAGEVIRYELTDGYVEVKAGPDGMASIWDYDIVLMMVSHLTESMNLFKTGRGPMPARTFIPHTSDIAKFCRRGDGGRQADDIESALDRLLGTTIKSVRESPSRNGKRTIREVEAEGLIGPYKVVSRTDTGKLASVEIKAPDWIYREVTAGLKPDVLTVHPDYFLIEPGLGRFIYRLARRAAGKNTAKWSFRTIYERSGSTGTFKEFCRMIRKLIASNDLPEYRLEEEAGVKGPLLGFVRRDGLEPEFDGVPEEDPEPEADKASGKGV